MAFKKSKDLLGVLVLVWAVDGQLVEELLNNIAERIDI